MAEGRSERLDRVGKPSPGGSRDRTRSGQGTEALYSTSPQATPTSPVQIVCERCDVERGIGLLDTVRLLLPVAIVRPLARRVWTRCPACERYSWLRVRQGQALRALLDRTPWRA